MIKVFSMDGEGAEMDDATDPRGEGGLEDGPGPAHVAPDVPISIPRGPHLSGTVEHDLYAAHCAGGQGVRKVRAEHLGPPPRLGELVGLVPKNCNDGIALLQE
jgi:hypothetical protein